MTKKNARTNTKDKAGKAQSQPQAQQGRQADDRRREFQRPPEPVLRFCPAAWAKLLYFRDRGPTEIGGFAVTRPDDLLYVADFVTVRQEATAASVDFDDAAVADFFEDQVDAGRKPEQFARIWCHSHPGDSPKPSSLDEETFGRVFGNCQWAVMCIVAQGGKRYARLRFNVGPGGSVCIPVQVDFAAPFAGSDRDAWAAEYDAHVRLPRRGGYGGGIDLWDDEPCCGELLVDAVTGSTVPDDWLDALEDMDPTERQAVLDELTARGELLDGEEVCDEC